MFIVGIALFYLVIMLPVYIYVEQKRSILKAKKYKLALSFVFGALGLWGLITQNFTVYSILIFLGLCAAIAGDYFLVYIRHDRKKFLKGVFLFGLTQLFYTIAMYVKLGTDGKEVMLAAVAIAVIWQVTYRLEMNLHKEGVLLSVYPFLVTFMAVKAGYELYMLRTLDYSVLLFSVGALLFFASDIFLGLWRFYKSVSWYKYMVAIGYFGGQLLIAVSLFY